MAAPRIKRAAFFLIDSIARYPCALPSYAIVSPPRRVSSQARPGCFELGGWPSAISLAAASLPSVVSARPLPPPFLPERGEPLVDLGGLARRLFLRSARKHSA